MFLKVILAAVGNGVWRGQKGKMSGESWGPGPGCAQYSGKKQMEGRHTMVVESMELGDGFDVGGENREESRMTLRCSD